MQTGDKRTPFPKKKKKNTTASKHKHPKTSNNKPSPLGHREVEPTETDRAPTAAQAAAGQHVKAAHPSHG